MAFWGIEIKPGKPFTHRCEKSKGRLRISQATLGFCTGSVAQKVVVQCNVGNRGQILLCALLPNLTESCHLDLEFEEAEDVVFSVIGAQSVYLTGYYLLKNHKSNHQSDTESYGVDIENTQTEGSSFCSDDDIDSFIDNFELQVSPLAPVLSLKAVDGTALKKDTPNDRKHLCKQIRKRNQEIRSDGDETHKTDDGHGYLLSVLKSTRCSETTMSDDVENIAQVLVKLGEKAEDSGNCGSKPTEKVDPDTNGKPEREATMGLDENGWVKIENNERAKKVRTPEKTVDKYEKYLADDKADGSKGVATIINQHLPLGNEKDCSQLPDIRKCAYLLYALSCFLNYSYIPICLIAASLGIEISTTPKRKRRKHSLQEEKVYEFEIGNDQSVPRVKKVQEVESSINLQPKKKIKKKGKKKARGKRDMDMDMDMMKMKMKSDQENMVMKYEDHTTQVIKTALSNGLIIEELAQGPPDGKIAAVGKKIKVFYTAMLMESGKVFHSNMTGTAFRCCLGDEAFIDGWNIGIDGMRIGDKRRLIIPPSMGFGSHGVGENVPPNSWLVYDIELVNVR